MCRARESCATAWGEAYFFSVLSLSAPFPTLIPGAPLPGRPGKQEVKNACRSRPQSVAQLGDSRLGVEKVPE